MMEDPLQFIVDEDLQKRLDLLEGIDKTIKSKEAYTPRAIFLKRLTLQLIRAVKPKSTLLPLARDDSSLNLEGVYVINEPTLSEEETHSLDNLRVLLTNDPSLLRKDLLLGVITKEANKSTLSGGFISKALYYLHKHFIGFGALQPLMDDANIQGIYCLGIGTPVLVDYQDKRRVRTTLSFDRFDDVNTVLLHLAARAEVELNDNHPILDSVVDGWSVKGVYGSNLISSTFSLVRTN